MKIKKEFAQTAIEYMILLTVVATITFLALSKGGVLERSRDASEGYFNAISERIMGDPPDL
ncbi:MAG: hypothetical protein ABIJ41_06590 [Candidatus Omnitrophota bacterium]